MTISNLFDAAIAVCEQVSKQAQRRKEHPMTADDPLDSVDWKGLGNELSEIYERYGLCKIGDVITQISVGEDYSDFAFVTEQDGDWWAM